MARETTEAWLLKAGGGPHRRLERGRILLPPLRPGQLVVDPLFGSWEANMTHAINAMPLDICAKRREPYVVLGNCGVVRVVAAGDSSSRFEPGDVCLLIGFAQTDAQGYTTRVFAYDDPGTVGLLAKRTHVEEFQLIALPDRTRHSVLQWAAFAVRHLTAWANWHATLGCWRALVAQPDAVPRVCAWGGGVSLAELRLARAACCRTAMLASSDARLAAIGAAGICPVDRRAYPDLSWEPERYDADAIYRARYDRSERAFVDDLSRTLGGLPDIFIDNIGLPVWRATLRALNRPGVVTTAGWRRGGDLQFSRPLACFHWHCHVHTHFINMRDVAAAVTYAEREGWMPTVDDPVCAWDDIGDLADRYAAGRCESYFPLFAVNGSVTETSTTAPASR